MDRWLAAVEADPSDACFVDGVKVTDPDSCRATFHQRDYNVAFTSEQWTRLRKAFPHGVCDYRKPGADRQSSAPWLTYRNGPGGSPLPAMTP